MGWHWNTVEYAVAFVLVASVVLLFVVARRARTLEEPKIEAEIVLRDVTMSERRILSHLFAIQVENTSYMRIDNVECVVTRLVYSARGRSAPIHRHLQFIDTTNATSTSLNPRARKHAVLFAYETDSTGQYVIRIAENAFRVEPGEMGIEVEISAANAPAEARRCSVEAHENGEMKAVGLKLTAVQREAK